MSNKITSDELRGHADTMILKLLLENDRYGYEIAKLIHQSSEGEYDMKEATLYASLKRLEKDDCITWYWGDETQGGRRKYYQVTQKGRQVYVVNKENWEQAQRVLNKLL